MTALQLGVEDAPDHGGDGKLHRRRGVADGLRIGGYSAQEHDQERCEDARSRNAGGAVPGGQHGHGVASETLME